MKYTFNTKFPYQLTTHSNTLLALLASNVYSFSTGSLSCSVTYTVVSVIHILHVNVVALHEYVPSDFW